MTPGRFLPPGFGCGNRSGTSQTMRNVLDGMTPRKREGTADSQNIVVNVVEYPEA